VDNTVIAAWLGGLLIGWFIVLHFIVIGRSAGCSTGYACIIDKMHKKTNLFGKLDNFKFFFILGLPLGGLAHVFLFQGTWQVSFDMGMYEGILPAGTVIRALILLIGGVLLGFGARMAGGCTTGHALVGGALLNWSSILAAILFFAFATVTSWLLFSGFSIN